MNRLKMKYGFQLLIFELTKTFNTPFSGTVFLRCCVPTITGSYIVSMVKCIIELTLSNKPQPKNSMELTFWCTLLSACSDHSFND